MDCVRDILICDHVTCKSVSHNKSIELANITIITTITITIATTTTITTFITIIIAATAITALLFLYKHS